MNHRICRTDAHNKRYVDFTNKHHPLGHKKRPTRTLNYLLFEEELLVGTAEFSSGIPRIRDVLIRCRKLGLHGRNDLCNNSRLCLHGAIDKNAGTKFLSLCRRDVVKWWMEKYKDKIKAFQTFVDESYNGSVYKADNWEFLGRTCGHKKVYTGSKVYGEMTKVVKVPQKLIFWKDAA